MRYRGLATVDFAGYLMGAAYNLVRLARLVAPSRVGLSTPRSGVGQSATCRATHSGTPTSHRHSALARRMERAAMAVPECISGSAHN
jgi:hypothetical protein